MDSGIVERRISCPFCGEAFTLLLDVSVGGQAYVEDCQVCCQPMHVSFEVDDGMISSVHVSRD
jgi:transcription elongation factor Elf1